MSKRGSGQVVGVGGAAIVLPLAVAAGGLGLAAYLAIRGTSLALRGSFLVGQAAWNAVERAREERERRRQEELERQRAERARIVSAHETAVRVAATAVDRFLAAERLAAELRAGEILRARERAEAARAEREGERKALEEEIAIRRADVTALIGRQEVQRAERTRAYVESLAREQSRLARLARVSSSTLPDPGPAPDTALGEKHVAEAMVREATRLVAQLPHPAQELRQSLVSCTAMLHAGQDYGATAVAAEALVREAIAAHAAVRTAIPHEAREREAAWDSLHRARAQLLTEDYLPDILLAEGTRELEDAQRALDELRYREGRERAERVLTRIEGWRGEAKPDELRRLRRAAEDALTSTQAAADSVLEDEGVRAIVRAMHGDAVLHSLERERQQLVEALQHGRYEVLPDRSRALRDRAEQLVRAAVAHLSASQRDLVLETAAGVLGELGYQGITRQAVEGPNAQRLVIGFKGETPFWVSVNTEGRIQVDLGEKAFATQADCSKEIELFFRKMRERGIVLGWEHLESTHPEAATGAIGEERRSSAVQQALLQAFEEVLNDMGASDVTVERSPEGVELTAMFAGRTFTATIDETGVTTDDAGQAISPTEMRERLVRQRDAVLQAGARGASRT